MHSIFMSLLQLEDKTNSVKMLGNKSSVGPFKIQILHKLMCKSEESTYCPISAILIPLLLRLGYNTVGLGLYVCICSL